MKKVYETALHVADFRSILSPPTRTHIMNDETKLTTAQYVKIALESLDAMTEKEKLEFSREVSNGFNAEINANW